MANTFLFFGGRLEMEDSPFSSKNFPLDALAVQELTESELGGVVRILDESSAVFLSQKELGKMLASAIAEPSRRRRVVSFIYNMERLRRSAPDDVTFLRDLPDRIKRDVKVIGNLDVGILVSRVNVLIRQRSAIELQEKAESLASRTGKRLHEFYFVSDLRPVFDRERGTVIGLMPLTTLKLVALDPSGLPVSIEVRLTERELSDVVEKASIAKGKLTAMKSFVGRTDAAIPETELTDVTQR